jgi:DNA-binding NarL/FixJ family response regulator
MITLILVDDHVVIRKGLRLLLEQQPDISVVGEGGDGAQAIKLASDLLPARCRVTGPAYAKGGWDYRRA